MKIRIHSHEGAAVLHPRRYGAYSAAMVRISTMPQFVPLVFRDAYIDVIELRFADVTETSWNYISVREQDLIAEQLKQGHAMWPMTTDQAKQIAEFVHKVVTKDKIDLLVCHCDAGVSRSAAVATVVCEHLGLMEELAIIQRSRRFNPNQFVCAMLRKQFEDIRRNNT